MSWKLFFTDAVCNYIELKMRIRCDTQTEAALVLENTDIKQKWGIWKHVAEILCVPKQQAHDYYYNTWQKQVYDDPKPHAPQLRQLFLEHSRSLGESEAREAAVAELVHLHPGKQFHRPTLVKMLNQFQQTKAYLASKKAAGERQREDLFAPAQDIADFVSQVQQLLQ